MQSILAAQHGEVGKADLVRVAGLRSGDTEEFGLDGILVDLQFEVAAVEEFGPLEFGVDSYKAGAAAVGVGDRDVLPGGGGRGDG